MAQRKHRDVTGLVLRKMMTENTGRHMLDSGGAYGRNWERNQKRKFEREPEGTLKISRFGWEMTLSTYHTLKAVLSYDAAMTAKFKRFANRADNKDECWLVNMEAFVEELAKNNDEVHHPYGHDASQPYMTINTYNHESLLDQTIQYTQFVMDDEHYVLLQIHGGCDVRGGYTAPRAFRITADCEEIPDQRATITCDGECPTQGNHLPGFSSIGHTCAPHTWDTSDGGCRWEPASYEGRFPDADDVTFEKDGKEWEAGKVHVDIEGHVHCPKCNGEMKIYPFIY